MHVLRLLTLSIVIPLFAACSSSGGSSGGNRTDSDSGGGSLTNNALDPTAQAENNVVRNARIILYQPQNRQRMIIVNHNHQLRKTLDGRRRLALGQRGQGYKVLSDKQIDALLESVKIANGQVIREPASAADFKYLKVGPGEIPDYKGIVIVENNGQLTKYVGWRANNDPLKAERYKVFVDVKSLVARWHSANSQVELPSPAMRGGSDPNQFNVPRPTRGPDGRRR